MLRSNPKLYEPLPPKRGKQYCSGPGKAGREGPMERLDLGQHTERRVLQSLLLEGRLVDLLVTRCCRRPALDGCLRHHLPWPKGWKEGACFLFAKSGPAP